MKKILFLSLLLSLVTAYASPVWVSVKKSVIRKDPSNLSAMVAKVKYQDELELMSEQGDWWQVSYQNAEGWVHKSALSKSLQSGGAQGQSSSGGGFLSMLKGGSSSSESNNTANKGRSANADDITLAGKGFNEDVEGQFKSQGASKLNYAAVDAMENRKLPPFDFDRFADGGDLQYAMEVAEEQQEGKSWGGFSLPGGLFK